MAEVGKARGGRIRWRRFLAVFAAGIIGAGGLLVGMAQGALAVSFAVAATPVKVSADFLKGFGFVAFGAVDHEINGTLHPVVVNGFRRVFLSGYCQSVVTPVPIIGPVTIRTVAPSVDAVNLVSDLQTIAGTVSYFNFEGNIDASLVTAGPPGVRGAPHTSGTQAQATTVRNLREIQWATAGGTLTYHHSLTRVLFGAHPCFPDL